VTDVCQNHGHDRLAVDPVLAAWNERMGALHADVCEVKAAIKEVASALTKLALVEERQTHHAAAQERAFSMMSKLEARLVEHERRLVELEKAEPAQARTSEWVDRMVWAAASGAGMLAASRLGLLG
jgi:hypothetical protein